jgi:hypothetical protein
MWKEIGKEQWLLLPPVSETFAINEKFIIIIKIKTFYRD